MDSPTLTKLVQYMVRLKETKDKQEQGNPISADDVEAWNAKYLDQLRVLAASCPAAQALHQHCRLCSALMTRFAVTIQLAVAAVHGALAD